MHVPDADSASNSQFPIQILKKSQIKRKLIPIEIQQIERLKEFKAAEAMRARVAVMVVFDCAARTAVMMRSARATLAGLAAPEGRTSTTLMSRFLV